MALDRARLFAGRRGSRGRRDRQESGTGEILHDACSTPKPRRKIAAASRTRRGRRIVFIAAISRREIVAWSDANGGLLQASDLAAFKTRIETPVSAEYRGATVYKCGPWSQGPVFLQQLKILEGFDLAKMGHNSPTTSTARRERETRIRRSRGILRRSGIRRVPHQSAGVQRISATCAAPLSTRTSLDGSAPRRSDRDASAAQRRRRGARVGRRHDPRHRMRSRRAT